MKLNITSDQYTQLRNQGYTKEQIVKMSQAGKSNFDDILRKATKVSTSIFPGGDIGKAVGTSIYGLGQLAKGDLQGALAAGRENKANYGRIVGDTIQSVTTPLSFALTPAKTAIGAGLQFGALGAASGVGSSLQKGGDIGSAIKSGAISGGISAPIGVGFNLLGKALAKAGPKALSFTTGVPEGAISQSAKNPETAKKGLDMSVEQIRTKAVESLDSLYGELGDEYGKGLATLSSQTRVAPEQVSQQLQTQAQTFAKEMKIAIGKKGLDFSRSAVVNPSEQKALEETMRTLAAWDDYSPTGMDALIQRVGALRKFDSGAQTRSSAVVGKIYNSINEVIKQNYPELAQIRTSYGTSKEVLDEIQNVLSANKDSPVSIQGSITRLSNIYKQDREGYVNIIRELSNRSGVDYLSLIAGNEFQRVLPDFIRGLGGAGAVSVGASLLNPYLILLAPIFSPRFAGLVTRNATAIGDVVSRGARAAVTETAGQMSSGK